MRQQARDIPKLWFRLGRYLVLALVVAFATPVSADSRSDARNHYQAGVAAYGSGDYKSAIREFSAAQQLAPADLNNYNLALCYDKLGDPEPAIQYYRAYLDKVPNTDKRGEIEASISRLESAAKSIAAKKAEEARRLEEAKKVEEAKLAEEMKKIEEARRANEAMKAEEAAKRAEEAARAAPQNNPNGDGAAVGGIGGAGIGGSISGSGSTGTPGSGTLVTTGDAQLDRVQQIDINAIRDQRVGGAGSGIPDSRGGPAVAAGGAAAQPNANPNAGPPAGNAAHGGVTGLNSTVPEQPKAAPVYKKWWFWALVAVGAYVAYEVATTDSKSPNSRARELPLGPQSMPGGQAGGATLFRW